MKEKSCGIVKDKGKYTAGYYDITESIELIKQEAKKEVFDDKEFNIIRNTKRFQNIVNKHLTNNLIKIIKESEK